jgi:hypothetical protein
MFCFLLFPVGYVCEIRHILVPPLCTTRLKSNERLFEKQKIRVQFPVLIKNVSSTKYNTTRCKSPTSNRVCEF